MNNEYIDRDAFLEFLSSQGNQDGEALRASILKYIEDAPKTSIIHCRDCATFSTQGVAEGYGWCKKFCFGPEEDFYCLMGEEKEEAPEEEKTETEEAQNG